MLPFKSVEPVIIIFVLHSFMSFAMFSENLMNVFTFPLMQLMVWWARSGAEGQGNTDIGIGLLMYPTMILNSVGWTLVICGILKLAEHLIRTRKHNKG